MSYSSTTELTSTRSPRVNAAKRLVKRAFRDRDGRFLAEGPQACREAAALPGVLLELYVTAEAADRHRDVLDAARAAGTDIVRASGEVVAALSGTVTPQGMVGVCRTVTTDVASVLSGPQRLVTVLAHARDPGNVGTVIRCSDAAGAGGVILTEASVDPQNPKAVRASAGSLFHLPVATGPSAAELVDALHAAGLQVLAADGAGERDLDDLEDAGVLAAPTAWVFGNEAWGLPEATRALCDDVVRVPIHGRAESLNLATAAAVCLYASARAQRRR
ncbi:MAG: TrmH family RNA methyltransferase [Candidatus Nanopelagicales bacterium]|jgi:TrmH family RNA methyltransferase